MWCYRTLLRIKLTDNVRNEGNLESLKAFQKFMAYSEHMELLCTMTEGTNKKNTRDRKILSTQRNLLWMWKLCR